MTNKQAPLDEELGKELNAYFVNLLLLMPEENYDRAAVETKKIADLVQKAEEQGKRKAFKESIKWLNKAYEDGRVVGQKEIINFRNKYLLPGNSLK